MPLTVTRLRATQQTAGMPARPRPISLRDELDKSYLDLFQVAPALNVTSAEIQNVREELKKGRGECSDRFKERSSQYAGEIKQAQEELRSQSGTLADAKRHELHCRIQNLRAEQSQTEVLAKHSIPIGYDNLEAKLDLIQNWPQDLKTVQREIADGSYLKRRWGDVKDIGFREIASGQEKDIKTGQDALKQMKASAMMPKEMDAPAIVDYVTAIAKGVAAHSDLHVPLHVTVLDSKEINAFALPGGYLFVERGLLDAADDESELAGVLSHEIGHDCARHGAKLMHRATVAGILFEAAEIAGMVFTGGVMGIGTYYALEYGYEGLSMLLDLSLLGVSREYELQADQLGIQYAWNSGYDPTGFIRFFDKMATKVGFVNGVAWFYDHPPFYERMVDAEREITFLPKKPRLLMQTTAFLAMKKELAQYEGQKKELKVTGEEAKQPHLIIREEGCSKPREIALKPGETVEALCSRVSATRQ
jgi:hypothetical protein